MKRVILFLATNFAIVIVLSVSMRLLGVEPYLQSNGLNLNALLIFAAVIGFGGSLISLALSKWMAKRSFRAQKQTRTMACRYCFQTSKNGRYRYA